MPPPTAPGAHDAGIEYGEIAADIAADNMAAHIAAATDFGETAGKASSSEGPPAKKHKSEDAPLSRRSSMSTVVRVRNVDGLNSSHLKRCVYNLQQT